MTPASVLLVSRLKMLRTAVRRSGWAQRAVAALYLVLASAIIAGVYLFFLRAFPFVLADKIAGPLILRYILEVAFAMVFFLGVASFVVTSYSLIYRAEELGTLVPMPIPPGTLYAHRFAAATALSSWPVLAIAVPALAALGTTIGASWSYAAFGVAITLLFTLAITVLGGLLSFGLAWMLRPLSVGVRKALETASFFVLGAMLVRHMVPRAVFTMFYVDDAAQIAEAGDRLAGMFFLMPSHPFAVAVSSVLPYGPDGSAAFAVALAAAAIAVGSVLLTVIAPRAYLPLWQRYGESGFIAGPLDRPRRAGTLRPFPRVFRFGHSFLFEKDLLSFVRDSEALSRAGFLLMLLSMYLLTVRAVALNPAFQRADLSALMVVFTFAAIGYFALTLALRFVFPSLSLEGRGAWLVWSSPIHSHEIFSWKFFFWAVSLSAAMSAAAVLVIILFGFPWPLASMFVAAVFASSVSLVALTLSIGSFSPDFRTKDPDLIATSPAGLAATAAGAGYLWIMARYVHRATVAYLATGAIDPLALVGMSVVSLAVIAASWAAAMRLMDRMEVV